MSPVDALAGAGSDAYRGRPRFVWGARLVEPAGVAAIRLAAAPRLVDLGRLAEPKSGIPPRAVGFFCVKEERDPALLTARGITTGRDKERLALVEDGRGVLHVIERESLLPLLRRPVDIENRIEPSSPLGDDLLFYVHHEHAELERRRLRGTVDYIAYGARTDFVPRGGSRRAGGVPSERDQVRVRNTWYAVPKQPLDADRVALPKGHGNVHYATRLPADVAVLDNFLYLSMGDGRNATLLPAVMNLSWTYLMLEVYGRRTGGDGILHAYIRELSMLPVPDPRVLTQGESDDLTAAFEPVASRRQLPVEEELRQADRQAFDLVGMGLLVGSAAAEPSARRVESALRDLAVERQVKAASGRDEVRRSTSRRTFDAAAVAVRVAAAVGRPPDLLSTLPGIRPPVTNWVEMQVPEHDRALTVTVGETLFETDAVLVNGAVVLSAPSGQHAAALAACVRTDPDLSGTVRLPADRGVVRTAVAGWEALWERWSSSLDAEIARLLPGTRSAQRRDTVRVSALDALGAIG